MPGIGGDHKGALTHAEQIVLAHHPQHALVVYLEAAPSQFRRDSPIAVGRQTPEPPSASDRGFPFPPDRPAAACASGRSRHGSDRSSGRARSRLRLSPRLARLLQTGIHSSGQRGCSPRFGYGAPHSSTGGTSTLLSKALLSALHPPLWRPPWAIHSRANFFSEQNKALISVPEPYARFNGAYCRRTKLFASGMLVKDRFPTVLLPRRCVLI